MSEAGSQLEVRALGPEEVSLFRDVRLRALAESPGAFGSSLDVESPQEEQWWRQRLAKWTQPGSGAAFVALADDNAGGDVDGVGAAGDRGRDGDWIGVGEACGLAAVFTRAEEPGRAELASMWVSPACRGGGVGRRLVEAVEAWCREQGVRNLHLQVAEGNGGAVAFYERLGFRQTGGRQPMPRREGVCELEMRKPLA